MKHFHWMSSWNSKVQLTWTTSVFSFVIIHSMLKVLWYVCQKKKCIISWIIVRYLCIILCIIRQGYRQYRCTPNFHTLHLISLDQSELKNLYMTCTKHGILCKCRVCLSKCLIKCSSHSTWIINTLWEKSWFLLFGNKNPDNSLESWQCQWPT